MVVPDGQPLPPTARSTTRRLLAAESPDLRLPRALDENAAAMLCYTSGTTGNPKGVLYSHRSTVLHTLVASMRDTLGVRPGRHRAAGGADVPRRGVGVAVRGRVPPARSWCFPGRTSTPSRCST